MEKFILFMDNMQKFLDVHARLLEQANYRVYRATSIPEAEKFLFEKRVHLAILDIRMEDEEDPQDMSGLTLAKKMEFQALPKIMLTAHVTDAEMGYRYAREALGISINGLKPAVEFIAKHEGPDNLLQAVERAFRQHVRINGDLIIRWNDHNPLSFSHLASLIYPSMDSSLLAERTGELEDLFRKLFHDEKHILLERLFWQRDGRVAVSVHAFRDDASYDSFLVVCGDQTQISQDIAQYQEHAPRAPGDTATTLHTGRDTLHYAGNLYGLARANFARLQTLQELYNSGQERTLKFALTTLFEKTLAEWHQGRKIVLRDRALANLYRQRLHMDPLEMPASEFEKRIRSLMDQVPALDGRLKVQGETLEFVLGHRSIPLFNPFPLLFQAFPSEESQLLIKTSGTLTGSNILADDSGKVWLTDFVDAGLAPLSWNFVALEAAIRFDWTDMDDLHEIYQMEHCLLHSDFSYPDANLVEQSLRKPLRSIQAVRSLANVRTKEEELAYSLGVFFQAASRIAGYDPAYPCTPVRLLHLMHAWLAMAMLGEKIGSLAHNLNVTPEREQGLRIDFTNHEVWVKGKRVTLRGQGYDLLCYLYARPNQVCLRADIARDVFKVKDYDSLSMDAYDQEVGRMNAAIHRLREKIEEDPGQPCFLQTHEGVGYKLNVSGREDS